MSDFDEYQAVFRGRADAYPLFKRVAIAMGWRPLERAGTPKDARDATDELIRALVDAGLVVKRESSHDGPIRDTGDAA